jgi:hypothetical protein
MISEISEQLFRQPLSRELEPLGLFICSLPSDYIAITYLGLLPQSKKARETSGCFWEPGNAHLYCK